MFASYRHGPLTHTRYSSWARFDDSGDHDTGVALKVFAEGTGVAKPTNDRNQAVTKFCLAMEEHRRTEAGRVRTPKEFVRSFFPYDESKAEDRLFLHIPQDIRGPVISQWGIRGAKAALRDDDEKIRDVVHDALVSGDIDENAFEEGITPQIFIDWMPLWAFWAFWRNGKLTNVAIQKALAVARELELIDDKWFLANIEGRGGKLKGTDVLCDTLSKDQIVAWVRKIHESGDGSPSGIVAAIGWETILAKTAQDALLFALDQFARKAGLLPEQPPPKDERSGAEGTSSSETIAASAPSQEPTTGQQPTIDEGLPISIPEVPAVDGPATNPPTGDEPSVPSTEERGAGFAGTADESPKLAEARAKMMEMLGQPPPPKREPWDDSEVPAKPSSLEWPEPEPIVSAATGPDVHKASPSGAPGKVPAPNPPPVPRKNAPRPGGR